MAFGKALGGSHYEQALIDEVKKKALEIGAKDAYLTYDGVSPNVTVTLTTDTETYKVPVATNLLQVAAAEAVAEWSACGQSAYKLSPQATQADPAAVFAQQFTKLYGPPNVSVKYTTATEWKAFWEQKLIPPVEPPAPPPPPPASPVPPPPPPASPVPPLPTISQPASDLLTYDEHGFAALVGPVASIPPLSKDLTRRIKEIADAFGTGSIVGRGRSAMSKQDKVTWLKAWYGGDLKTCYLIENQNTVKVSARHPGHPKTPQTHRIVWAPQVPGELPAGLLPEGDWSSPETHPPLPECNNYLLAAHMAYPHYLGSGMRRRWMQAHMRGDKDVVDEISWHAKVRAEGGGMSYGDPLEWSSSAAVVKVSGYEDYLAVDNATHMWHVGALKLYAADYGLDHNGSWASLVGAVQSRRAESAVAQAAGEVKLILTTVPNQPQLGGYHPKSVLVDQHGLRWVFKPARDDAHRFRPEIEHAAHQLARLWGYPTAESHLVDHDGAYGQIQHMFTEAGHLGGYTADQIAGFAPAHLIALACEHLLDWALDNDDSHGENIILTIDGQLVGIDKARAYAYFGAWDGLSSHDSANSNAQLVYTELYRAIKTHLVERDTADRMYRAVLARARRMERLPDEQMADILRAGVANRPHYRPPSYRAPHPATPTCADELITAALARKNSLEADMRALWERIYADAGWELPDPTIGVLGENPQGHLMHSGLHTPELHEAISRTKSYGTPAFVAGEDIEDAHILLWRERCQGVYRVRGQFKIRPGSAFNKVKKWCKDHAVAADEGDHGQEPKVIPREDNYYSTIITVAKSVSFHADDGEYNAQKLNALKRAKVYLEVDLGTATDILAAKHPDPYGQMAATVEMATQYLGYIATIEAHKANKTKSKEGDFPRYEYKPTQPAEPEADSIQIRVERRRATRAAATHAGVPVLAEDGELRLEPGLVLRNSFNNQTGQSGRMYLVTLTTGEEIEFRADTDTDTPLSEQGLVQFTIADAATTAESLRRIDDQLATMGVTITDADLTDLELFYWRHLSGVLANRCDSKLSGSYHQPARFQAYWAALNIPKNASRDVEIAAWRTAFAPLTGAEQLAQFVASDGHLPRFMHMDLRNPGQPCGKPYWERFDVSDAKWQAKQMPTLTYRSGPEYIMATGVAMATDARTRTFAVWKIGMSSAEDMSYGSSAFIFTRNNQEHYEDHQPNVYFSPRIARRTSTYAFGCDKYGRLSERDTCAPFDFDKMMSFADSSNEMMVKDALSLLDDIEILLFETDSIRAKAVARLAELGITKIRGVPVAVRFIVRGDKVAKAKAVTAARESFKRGQYGMAETTR